MSFNEKVIVYDQFMRVKVTLNPAASNNETQQQCDESASTIDQNQPDGVTVKKKRKRGKEYIEDPRKRSKSRSQRKNGLLHAMGTLKLVSGDETYLEITNANSKEVAVFSTSQQILLEKGHFKVIPSQLSPSETAPSQVVLPRSILTPSSPKANELSPSTPDLKELNQGKRSSKQTAADYPETLNPDQCQICKRTSSLDTDLMSPWVKCDNKGCFYWCHMICLGIESPKEVQRFE